jgi:hypothetical protein
VIEVAKKTLSFDSKCYDLAEHFLQDEADLDSEDKRKELAQEIQEAIEAWLLAERDERDVKDPS